MPGVSSLLDIGSWALMGSQSAIEVTGNNISNVNTEGYSRQEVRFEENDPINFSPGQLGTGVVATDVIRHFNTFIEEQYLDKYADEARYENLWETLKSVDSLFDETSTEGLNAALSRFFQDWQDLSLRPDDFSTREALIGHTQSLIGIIENADSDMARMQEQMEDYIQQEVDSVNNIINQIAEINEQIGIHDVPGVNNTNTMYDNRAQLVRELAGMIDVDTIDAGGGEFKVLTKSGYTLVDGTVTFEVAYEGPQKYQNLGPTSNYDGEIHFEGSDSFEYTVQVVSPGFASNASGSAATYRVSLDGGTTWLTDDDGNQQLFQATKDGLPQTVGNLQIWFDESAAELEAGDTFTIVPKNGIYWYENTSSKVNITPQIAFDGTDNERRITGGSLAGYSTFSDYYLGQYRERLDALSESLAWEVNRLHSQGEGLTHATDVLGTYAVQDTSVALGENSSGLAYYDRLQEGNMTMYMYDADTGELLSNASLQFSGTGGATYFDPAEHSLQDVADSLNSTFSSFLSASIQNNQLRITTNAGVEMGFGTDSAGVWSALGVNTFFSGHDAASFGINTNITVDLNRVNAGHINGSGEANEGDNAVALSIGELEHKDVTIATAFESGSSQTLLEYHNSLVASVGADTASAEYNYAYHYTLTQDLNDRQEEVSGVNLDEEMSNLIKYQHSYRAAAKLITTADEMMQTVLGLKQ